MSVLLNVCWPRRVLIAKESRWVCVARPIKVRKNAPPPVLRLENKDGTDKQTNGRTTGRYITRLWSYPAPLKLRPYGAIQMCILLLLLLLPLDRGRDQRHKRLRNMHERQTRHFVQFMTGWCRLKSTGQLLETEWLRGLPNSTIPVAYVAFTGYWQLT